MDRKAVCFKTGRETEKRFYQQMESRGHSMALSGKWEDILDHWDVSYDGIKVDVKGLKKVRSFDTTTNEDFHWIEFVNVRGKWGWLYGKADEFVFELNDYWLFVNAQDLRDLMAEKCGSKKICRNPVPYEMYQRKDRDDWCTLVKTEDLKLIAKLELQKIYS